MLSILIVFHVIVSICLVAIVLMQRGRGGGFVENLSGLDSIFGTKTSTFLTKTTAVLATLFFLNCLVLALLSLQQSKSLMHNFPARTSTAVTTNTTTTESNVATSNTTTAAAPAAVTTTPNAVTTTAKEAEKIVNTVETVVENTTTTQAGN